MTSYVPTGLICERAMQKNSPLHGAKATRYSAKLHGMESREHNSVECDRTRRTNDVCILTHAHVAASTTVIRAR